MKLNKNQIYSVCLIILAGIVIYFSSQLESLFQVSNGDIGPRFMPIAASIGLIISSIGKFITERKDDGKKFLTKEGWKKVISIFLILIIYLIAINWVGYLISTPLAAAALVIAMKEDSKLSTVNLAVFSILITVVLYFVFQKVIQVTLPAGRLFR